MQDDFHAEDQPEVTPDEPTTSEPNDSNESADEATSAPRPAATASSYRDIIAERLARKGGGKVSGSTPSPLAHSSDVERAQWPDDRSSLETSPTMQGSFPANIEAITKRQELPDGEAGAEESSTEGNEGPQSSRERALLRQQERAALRRGGAARPQRREPEIQTPAELPLAEDSDEPVDTEEGPQPESDVIAARLARKESSAMRPDRAPQRPERRRAEDRPFSDDRSSGDRSSNDRSSEEPRREPSFESPRTPAQPPPATAPAGLTLRTARPAPREREEPRRRESAPTRRIETAEPRISAIAEKTTGAPEEKGAAAAVALAAKIGISVVIPLYNEQDSLRELTAALKQQCMRLAGPKYEILYINDGSTDRSGEILEDILATSSRVSTISFRRNLGKSAALAAGFAEAQYGIVITMDADLQDDPREFVNLIAKLSEGFDLVSGWKKKRQDPMSKTGPSKFFNWVTGMFSGIRLHDFNCGLKAYRKEVTDSLQVYGELHRYLPALAYWQGFRVTEIPVTHHPRKFGKSKFGSSRFFKGFLDLMSIVFTNRYGKRPLHLFGTIGTVMAVAGFVIDIWLTVEWALGLTSLSNRPILLLGLLLILVGVQLISIGLLGEMIVKNSISRASISYQKEKGRPSAEAQERRASRSARIPRVGGRPRPAGSERRAQPRRS